MAYIGSGLTRFNTADDLTVTDDAEIQGGLTVDTTTLVVDDANNRVGIGTTSPNNLLEVRGTSNGQNVLHLSNTAGASDGGANNLVRVTCNGNNNWANLDIQAYTTLFTQNGTERMRIDSSGNVGIGTDSPTGGAATVVDVYGSSSSAVNFHNATSGTTATDGGVVGQYGNDLVLFNYEAGIIQLGTNNTERMRIDSSGRVTMPYQPAVTAYPTNASSNTAGDGDQTHLVFGNVLFNNGNHYSTSTGIFTCPVAGYYFVSANIRWETINFAQTSYIRTFISKNDGSFNDTRIAVISGNNEAWGNYMDQTVSGVVYCSANDTLRLKGGENSATDAVYHGESSFSVYLLG